MVLMFNMYEYTSVTGFISSFFPPFDKDAEVDRILSSDKHENDPAYPYYMKTRKEILDMWENANFLGREMHKDIEETLDKGVIESPRQPEVYAQFLKFLKDHPSLKVVRTELAVSSDEYKLSGVADALFKDESTGEYVLVDWKRKVLQNSSIDYGKRAKYPIEDCPATSYCTYLLQINLYKYLLENDAESPITISRMYLVGFHPDNKDGQYVLQVIPVRQGILYKLLSERMKQVKGDKDKIAQHEIEKMGEVKAKKASTMSMLSAEQKKAYEMMVEGKSMFLTGRGGCGKSTLIKLFYAEHKHTRSIGLTSTTGTSALLIGGVTLFSFLGIGLGTGSMEQLFQEIMYKRPHRIRQRWRELDTLIIDEVSMLTPELFDKLELLARSIRKSSKPFGGIQIILTGDFYQLPCIGSENLCFNAKSWDSVIQNVVQLGHSFRQTDPEFEKCLDEVRIGELSDKSKEILLSRVNADLANEDGIRPTRVYSLNRDVNAENEDQLNALVRINPELEFFEYKLEYTVLKPNVRNPEEKVKRSCFAPEVLQICEGAQVMLIYNLDLEAKLANGSRGIVTGFDDTGFPIVKFVTGESRVIVYQEWYVEEDGEKLIKIIQLPLKVAYAGTVHKLQGASLDLVDVDCGHIFEYGMVYVALSRARTLQGLCIRNFDPEKVMAHPAVKEFYKKHA